MGQIYENARVVLVVMTEPFGLTQQAVDSFVHDVQGAVEMWRKGTFQEEGAKWLKSKNARRIQRAMDCLEVLTRPSWATRVWTMQEFVIAKRTAWVGGDLEPAVIDPELFQAIPLVCNTLSIAPCLEPKYNRLFDIFQGMAATHARQIELTRVMELLGHRTA